MPCDLCSNWLTTSMVSLAELVPGALREVLGELLAPPRLATAIVRDGEIVDFAGIDAGPMTRFRIASMTKSFTAAAVLQLRDRGTWRLDDPISRWVPEALSLRPPTDDSPAVTIRQLVTMCSGIGTDDPWGDRLLDLSPSDWRKLMHVGATFGAAPGTQMVYSNYGYALLGEAIARATNRTMQRYVTEAVLSPLGLLDTGWDVPANDVDWARPSHRESDLDELPPLADGAFAPMGGLWSNVVDLARWVGFLAAGFPARNGDMRAEDRVLSRASRRELQQGHTLLEPMQRETSRGTRPGELAYGMGLVVSHHPTLGSMVNHSGGLPGYGSNMRWLPDTGLGIVALGNRTYTPMRLLTMELFELLKEAGDIVVPRAFELIEAPDLEAAATALVGAIWGNGSFQELELAVNVALDLPLDRRAARAREFVAAVGELRNWTVEPSTLLTGEIVGQSATHTVRILLQLSPQVPPRLQRYELTSVPLPATTRA
jgi:CubicO group peptidase (beta-lactamase class C family)